MTKKLWFQLGVGILLSLFIIKYVVEVKWVFSPIFVVLKSIFLPLLLSGVLFYITVPIQTFLEKRKIPRWGTIIFIFLLLIAFIWAAISIVGPSITKQVNNLIENVPMIVQEANQFIIQLFQQTGSLPSRLNDSIDSATDSATESLNNITVQLGMWIVTFLQSIFRGTLVLVLVPFFLFFMLKDHEKFLPFIQQFFSGETKKWITKTLKDIDEVLSLYIRGQILISAILATLLYIGYAIIGLNFALLLSVFAFFMNVIPFIGPWIAFIPALIIGFFQDPMMVVWVSLTTLIAQQTDSNLITPNIMGKTLKIHPLTIITILFAAGSLAGFLGILLAVPGYAVGKAIVSNIYGKRKEIKETANKTV
ncbi:AI-2E family transporter [Pseudogracilibacillus sp. SO30301A]|uniref:AI-2E family transporter n=1 Tax=Pseudogracilibacillus sp. SO30301A TaxID=3098291 RepID=UPI00300E24A2